VGGGSGVGATVGSGVGAAVGALEGSAVAGSLASVVGVGSMVGAVGLDAIATGSVGLGEAPADSLDFVRMAMVPSATKTTTTIAAIPHFLRHQGRKGLGDPGGWSAGGPLGAIHPAGPGPLFDSVILLPLDVVPRDLFGR
jgi:hypothetical protein